MRVSPGILLVAASAVLLSISPRCPAFQVSTALPAEPVTIHPESGSLPADPHALYQALNELRADGTHVYSVQDLTLRRDAVNFIFAEGKLAFLPALGGHV